MDFLENGAIENFDKAQSENWQTLQYSLFMSTCSFLSVDKWNKIDGKLSKCNVVTVDGEFYTSGQPRPNINKEYFWAIVTAHIGGNLYIVEDKDGNVFDLERSRLRLRKRHVVCYARVSDEKSMIAFQCSISQRLRLSG